MKKLTIKSDNASMSNYTIEEIVNRKLKVFCPLINMAEFLSL